MSIYEGIMLRKARKAKGYTQTRLSQKLGISNAPINQFENGLETISLHRLRTICNELGLEVLIKQKDAE